jgi:hypothetical protein
MIVGQLPMFDVVDRGISVRDASTGSASVVRDVMSDTNDVAPPRASVGALQKGTEVSSLGPNLNGLACNVLLVFVPASLVDAADVGGERMRNGWRKV